MKEIESIEKLEKVRNLSLDESGRVSQLRRRIEEKYKREEM